MNAKEYLSQLEQMDKLLKIKEDQIKRVRDWGTRYTTAIRPDRVVESRNVTRMQDASADAMDLEKELRECYDRLFALWREIDATLSQVGHLNQRMVLEKHYMEFLPWDIVAEDMDYSVRRVQQLHQEGLQAVQAILDGRESIPA